MKISKIKIKQSLKFKQKHITDARYNLTKSVRTIDYESRLNITKSELIAEKIDLKDFSMKLLRTSNNETK